MNRLYVILVARADIQNTLSVGGNIRDRDHTSSCLSHYRILEFVALNILNPLQCSCLPSGVVLRPKGIRTYNLTPSPDISTGCYVFNSRPYEIKLNLQNDVITVISQSTQTVV